MGSRTLGYDEEMTSKRQFSLSYLFLEIFWIALAMGLSRLFPTQEYPVKVIISLLFCISTGAALGGLFKNMRYGVLLGAVIWILVAPFLVCSGILSSSI